MEKYDVISVVGEGSYGVVMKCRHRESGKIVAIKKFLETEDDPAVRKMAIREIKMLKKLRHENLVNMLEVFRRKRRYFIVFEYLEHTVLEELDARVGGLGFVIARKYIFQILRALDFIHDHNVIHRDVKPENVLVSRLGLIKLCDFGFARYYSENETFTDYVATRWYRAPELLVTDPRYGKEVDIWAVGCLWAEMISGEPLFPGETDIDQLYQIIRIIGKVSDRHTNLIIENPQLKDIKQQQMTSLNEMFPSWNRDGLDFLTKCLKMDGSQRPDTSVLLKHDLFTRDGFVENFMAELRAKINQETLINPILKNQVISQNYENMINENKKKTKPLEIPAPIKINNNQQDKYSQISLISLNGHRSSFGNEEQIAPFRHYLANAHSKSQSKQQISINNLVFKENERISSAKFQKPNINQTNTEVPSSPPRFQSLQTDLPVNQENSNIESKTLSPLQNLSEQYFMQKKPNSIPHLQQIGTQKANSKNLSTNAQNVLRSNIPKRTRTNILDINILPLSLGSNHETSPRILPPYPWLNSKSQKYSNNKYNNNITNINNNMKKGLTDWKTIAREPNDFLLPNSNAPSSSRSPYKGKKKLSPMSTISFNEKISENLNSKDKGSTRDLK